MTKNVLFRSAAFRAAAFFGLLLAQGMLQSCDRDNPLLTDSTTSDHVTLAPRFVGNASVPTVDSVTLILKVGQDSFPKTVPYKQDSAIVLGSVKPGDAFSISLMGFVADGTGHEIGRWFATGQDIAKNSSSIQFVDISMAATGDTSALSALPSTATEGRALPLTAGTGQTIWYTKDGNDPRVSGIEFTTASTLSVGTWTIALRQAASGDRPALWSGLKTITVTAAKPVVKAPTFSTTATWLFAGDSIVVTGTAGDVLRYTTNGTDPDSNSTPYPSAIKFTSDTLILKAIAMKSNVPSPVVSDTFYRARRDNSTYGIPWSDTKTYDSLLDQRDGHVYRTVTIGTQTWMAENLAYAGAGIDGDTGICYTNTIGNCAKFGRLYTWARAMGMDTSANHSLIAASSAQGVCPQGWQIPSKTQWETLASELGGLPSAGAAMRSGAGWSGITSTDPFGFRALLAGEFEYNPSATIMTSAFKFDAGHWWSYDAARAYEIRVSSSSSVSSLGEYVAADTARSDVPLRRNFYSVRCVKLSSTP
jgi:uncharacterized protein (TIGR02145 family)